MAAALRTAAKHSEIDRLGWFTLDEARCKINAAQAELLGRLEAALASPGN